MSSILIIGLLVFFVNVLLFTIYSTDEFIRYITDRIAINIQLQDGYDDTKLRTQELVRGISSSFSGVGVQYISGNDAFDIIKARNPDLAGLVEDADTSPFANSIRINKINDLAFYDTLNTYITGFRDIIQYDQGSFDKKLLNYRSQYLQVAKVVEKLQLLKQGVWVLLTLFAFSVSIVVYMIIHNFIFFLRDEIRIIELVGGKPSFIYGPFVIQGLIYALVSSVIAVGITYVIVRIMSRHQEFIEFAKNLDGFIIQFTFFAPWVIGISALIGAVSAFLASWKYIHSTIGE